MEKRFMRIFKTALALIAILLLGVIGGFVTAANAQQASESYHLIETEGFTNYTFYPNGYLKSEDEFVEFEGTYVLTGFVNTDVRFCSNEGEAATYNVIIHDWTAVAQAWSAMLVVEKNVTLNLYAYGYNEIIGYNHSGIKLDLMSADASAEVNLTVGQNAEVNIGYNHSDATYCVSEAIIFNVNSEAECSADLTGAWKELERVIFKRGNSADHSISIVYLNESFCEFKCDDCTDLQINLEHNASNAVILDSENESYASKHAVSCSLCGTKMADENHSLETKFFDEEYHFDECVQCGYKAENKAHNTNGTNACVDCGKEYEISYTVNDETKKYFYMANAAELIQKQGGTVTLLSNVDLVSFKLSLEKETIIDLAGFELSGTRLEVLEKTAIIDSSTEKTGVFNNNTHNETEIFGELIFNGITVDQGGLYCDMGCDLKIEGCKFLSDLSISIMSENSKVEIRDVICNQEIFVYLWQTYYNDSVIIYSGEFAQMATNNITANQLLPSGFAYENMVGEIVNGETFYIDERVTVVEHTHTFDMMYDVGSEHIHGCACGENEGEPAKHELSEGAICKGCGETLCITVIDNEGNESHFVSVESAFASINENDEAFVRLNSDASYRNLDVYGNVTFDLNGYTLASQLDRIFVYQRLTVCDSSKNGTGKLSIESNYGYIIAVKENGAVTVNSGEIYGIIYSMPCYDGGSVTIEINGGKFTSEVAFRFGGKTVATINGGWFENEEYVFAFWSNEVSLTLNGGIFVNPVMADSNYISEVNAQTVSDLLGKPTQGCELALLDEYGNELTTLEELTQRFNCKLLVAHKGATVTVKDGGHALYCQACDTYSSVLEHSKLSYEASKEDATLHTVFCGICGIQTSSEEHTGGKANCTELAVCAKCDEKYGELDESNHTGGRASCTELAVCERCQKEYGELDKTNHDSFETKIVSNGNKHDKVRECCQEVLQSLEHNYDSACDTDCGTCGAVREITHSYATDGICILCGEAGGSVTQPSEPQKGVGTGAIIGTVIGTVVVFGGTAFALIWFVIRKKFL